METDGVLERKGEVLASCERRENESHDIEREKKNAITAFLVTGAKVISVTSPQKCKRKST